MMEWMTKTSSKRSRAERPTITIELPEGWGRAMVAGLAAVLVGWLVPVAVAMAGFWSLADSPWMRSAGWKDAIEIGGSYWLLSLGAPAGFAGLEVTLIPQLWLLAQLLILRLLLGRLRHFSDGSVWAAIPAFTLLALVLGLVSGVGGSWWRLVLGALGISGLATVWAWLRTSRNLPAAVEKRPWVGLGVLLGVGYFLPLALAGTLTAALSWGAHWEQYSAAVHALDATGIDAAVLFVAQAGYLPLFGAWALAWLSGIGFSGPGQVLVAPGAPPTEIIPLPVWALVPKEPAPDFWWVFLLAGFLIGAASWAAARKREYLTQVLPVVATGFTVGVAGLASWMALSRGSLGGGMLDALGPHVVPVTGQFVLLYFLPALALPLLLHPEAIALVRRRVDELKEVSKTGEETPVAGEPDGELALVPAGGLAGAPAEGGED